MVRKLVTVLIVVALAMFGFQPRTPMAMAAATGTDASMHMSHDMTMEMTMDFSTDGAAAIPPCCPDGGKDMNQPCCDMQRGPNCAYACGAASPVFVQAPLLVLSPRLGKEPGAGLEFTGPAVGEGALPFRPPRSSIPA